MLFTPRGEHVFQDVECQSLNQDKLQGDDEGTDPVIVIELDQEF